MKKANISDAGSGFDVLSTSERTQTAMMTLAPGESSSEKPNTHKSSDQVLLVLEGELRAEVGDAQMSLGRGDVVIVPAGTLHKFTNRGKAKAVTFNTYSPPEY
jgi:mannose-6-phosphate isomerase-like protein (cupin superfamily)